MRAQNMVNKLDLYLGAQFIYIVGFGFPTIGSLMLGDLDAHSFPTRRSSDLRIHLIFISIPHGA